MDTTTHSELQARCSLESSRCEFDRAGLAELWLMMDWTGVSL